MNPALPWLPPVRSYFFGGRWRVARSNSPAAPRCAATCASATTTAVAALHAITVGQLVPRASGSTGASFPRAFSYDLLSSSCVPFDAAYPAPAATAVHARRRLRRVFGDSEGRRRLFVDTAMLRLGN